MNRKLHVKVNSARWIWSAAILVAALVPLSACDEAEEILGNVGDNEVFEFRYAYATYNAQGDYYEVQRGTGSVCTNPTIGNLTLAQLADLIQAQNTSYGIHACTSPFLVAGADAEAVRDDGGILFGVETTGGSNLTVYGNGLASSNTTVPSGLVIVTSGGVTINQKTTLGFAEVSFGTTGGDVWSCADGGPVWSQNANVASATFFEITVTQLDDTNKRAAGDFQCIARNTTDTNDTRLLLILDGGFAMNINN